MAENTDTIEGLDPLQPPNNIVLSEQDDQIRLIKNVIKTTFPGSSGNGFNTPIIATEAELNYLQGLTSLIVDQLAELKNGEVPVGGIIPYNGNIASIPARFFVCDGNNGTPNLVDRFIYSTVVELSLGETGGSADSVAITHNHSVNHDHTGSTALSGAHIHPMQDTETPSNVSDKPNSIGDGPSFTAKTEVGGAHVHTADVASEAKTTQSSGGAGLGTNIPPFYKLAFIMRTS